MKAMALFPDGFRTDQNPKRQTVQSSLLRMSFFKIHILGQTVQSSLQRLSFSKIHFLAFISGYRTPSPVCHCPILVRKPSGLVFPFKFKASIAGGEKNSSAEQDAAGAIAGCPSVSNYKTDGCLGNSGWGPRLQPRGDRLLLAFGKRAPGAGNEVLR